MAKFFIANIYIKGDHTIRNYKEAARIYEEILEDAQKGIFLEENYGKELNTYIIKELSNMYKIGGYELEKNDTKAMMYNGIKRNQPSHLILNTANFWLKGNEDIEKNTKESLYWYQQLIELNQRDANDYIPIEELLARNHIGTIYFKGDTNVKIDWKKAEGYYNFWYKNKYKFRARTLTDQQITNCMKASLNHINIYYYGGNGIAKNQDKAYTLSAEYYNTLKVYWLSNSQEIILQKIIDIYYELKE